MRQRLEQLPALSFEPVAGPGARVEIRVVDGRPHEPVRLDHGRGLEIVARDALSEHPDDGLRDVVEPTAVERQRDVERRHAPREKLVRRLDVRRAVALGQLLARMRGRGRLDLRIGHGRQPELGEDRLHRPRGPLSDAQGLVLGDRLDAAVDLPVALDREPLVDVVGVVVPPAEGVVCDAA